MSVRAKIVGALTRQGRDGSAAVSMRLGQSALVFVTAATAAAWLFIMAGGGQ